VTDKDIKRHLYEYLDNRHEEMNPRKGEPEGGDNRKALYEHLGTRPGDVQGTVADILQSEKETGETVGGFLLENRKRELDDMKKWLNKIWSGLKKEGIVAGKTRDALYEHLIKRQKEKYAAEQAPFVSKKEVGEIVKTFFRDKENKERENAIEWMRERWLRENNDLGIGGIASMGRDVTLQTLNYASDKGERKEILATSNKCEEWEAYNDKYELCGPYLKEEALAKILDRPEIVNYLGVIIGYAAGGDGEAKKMMDRCIQLTQNASGRYWDVLSNRSREENRYAWCVLLYATLKNVLDSDVLSDETKKVIDKYGIDKKSRIIDLLQKAPCIHRAAATWFVSSTIYTLALQTENIFEYHAGFLQDLWELWFKARPIDAPDTVSIIEAREKEEDLLLLIALSTRTNGIRIDLEKATKKKFLTSGFLYLLRGMSGQLSTGAFDAKGKRESAELYIDILDRIAEWSGQWVTGGKDEAFANLIDIANTKDDYGRGYLIAFMDIVEKTGARLPPYMLKIYESIMKKQKA
jgi:hypothetical protein